MPIQFRCQKCTKWLEVDEQHAGGKAVCPFCQAVNDVPGKSTAPAAEETGPGPFTDVPTEQTTPGAPEVPVSKPLESRQRESQVDYDQGWFDARRAGLPPPPLAGRSMTRLGIVGLALTLVGIGMFVASTLALFSYLPPDLRQRITQRAEGTTTQADTEQLQEELLPVARQHTWVFAVMFGGLVLNIVGFGLSLVAALTPGPHHRAAAWTGTIIGGLLFFCVCLNMMRPLAVG